MTGRSDDTRRARAPLDVWAEALDMSSLMEVGCVGLVLAAAVVSLLEDSEGVERRRKWV